MGLLDKFKKKAEETVEEHGEKIAEGVDKATDLIDKKTGGKHRDKLEKVDEMARDKLGDKGDSAD